MNKYDGKCFKVGVNLMAEEASAASILPGIAYYGNIIGNQP